MFGGGGGLNPRKMQKMMEQMGIDVTEIDAEEVIIRTAEEDLVFDAPDVTRMDARGQQTYQVVGDPTSQERGAAIEAGADEEADESEGNGESAAGAIPESDIEIVAQRTGASENEAREALEATDGDLAAAIDRLE